jgi:hypothetical protein
MSFPGVAARVLLGLVSLFAGSSQSIAQQYYYYPQTPTYSPTYTYAQPTSYYSQPVTWYTPQYYQTAYAQQPAQYTYSPQYYQQASGTQPTADGRQVIPASYTAPVAEAPAQQPAPTQPPAAAAPAAAANDAASDPYGFVSWLNATRASYGLGQVGLDANLSNWAAMNNGQQNAHGLGHFVMGPARRQNSAMGGVFPGAMWMASPAHAAALLDPTITWIGIAASGAYWTFNAY